MKDNNAFNEMMVHLPLCTHKEASNVLIIGTANEDMKNQAAKHSKVSNIQFGDVSLLTSKNEKEGYIYLALFNIGDTSSETITISLEDLGLKNSSDYRLHNLWTSKQIALEGYEIKHTLSPHSSLLLSVNTKK